VTVNFVVLIWERRKRRSLTTEAAEKTKTIIPATSVVKSLRARRLLRYFVPAAVLLTYAIATAWIVFEHRHLLRGSGLRGEYRAGATWDGTPELTTVEKRLSANLVRQRSRERHGAAYTVTWSGYLVVPTRDRYRFSVLADDRASIEIDKHAVIEGDRTRRESSIELARGLHPIAIRYYDGAGLQDLDVRWAKRYGPHDLIPDLLLVPNLISGEETERRAGIWRWSARLPLLWSATFIGSIAVWLVYRSTFSAAVARWRTLEMLPIYLVAAALFITGINWGLPDYRGWAVDELTPGQVDDILEHRFVNGWATIYPPVHFALLALASSPTYAADTLGVTADTLARYSQLFVGGRVLSVGMALALLAFLYHLTRSELGHRAARFAVMCVLLILPLSYYAKMANLDVPYLFWLTASWLFYMRATGTGSMRSACIFAATGAAAIATKDQAYAFYVLPAAHLFFHAFKYRLAGPSHPGINIRTLVAMSGVFVGVLLILFNVAFNLNGVREHLRLIVGPGSEPFRMYPSTVGGYLHLLRDSIWQMGSAMSWPLFILGIVGVVHAVRSGTLLVNRLLLFAVSYYLTFIAIVMYHYDRFFIGICFVLAIAAGAWLDRWTREGEPHQRLRLAAVALMMAYGGLRVVSLDVMMLRDGRYYAEHWIVDRIGQDTRVAAEGTSIYLPRQTVLHWTRMDADASVLRSEQPDFLVINPAHTTRSSVEGITDFYTSLNDGSTGYRRAMTFRTSLWFSPLRWEPRFNSRIEDPFSNVTKVNPTIEVYQRITK
jgi:PA14 domain-containing protein